MEPKDFCYWLQGFSEIHGDMPNAQQWQIIRDHLNLVFNKVTPNRGVVLKPSRPFYPDPPTEAVVDFEPVLKFTPRTDTKYCMPFANEQFLYTGIHGEKGESKYCHHLGDLSIVNDDLTPIVNRKITC